VCFSLNAQNKESVEKSIFSPQIGTVGVWVNNEITLSNAIALRTEMGFYMEIIKTSLTIVQTFCTKNKF
jgi:hypothetical protein